MLFLRASLLSVYHNILWLQCCHMTVESDSAQAHMHPWACCWNADVDASMADLDRICHLSKILERKHGGLLLAPTVCKLLQEVHHKG